MIVHFALAVNCFPIQQANFHMKVENIKAIISEHETSSNHIEAHRYSGTQFYT